jgi:hypothetical protein
MDGAYGMLDSAWGTRSCDLRIDTGLSASSGHGRHPEFAASVKPPRKITYGSDVAPVKDCRHIKGSEGWSLVGQST